MSADELYELASNSGKAIGRNTFVAKRNTRDVAIKKIKDKQKAKDEIQAYEDHDNARNIVCLYDSSIKEDYGVLVLECAKCNLWELVNCIICGNKLEDTITTTEKKEFMKDIRKWAIEESQKFDAADVWKNKKPTPLVLDLFRDVVQGLDDLHKKDFIHGYLEPSNIMVFNHLKRLSAKISLSRDCDKTWKSPGEKRSISKDMFGLGLILHFLVTGHYPFGDFKTCQQMLRMNQNNLSSSMSQELRNLIFTLLKDDVNPRCDTSMVLAHPIFWSPTRRLLFFCEVSQKLNIVYNTEIERNEEDDMSNNSAAWAINNMIVTDNKKQSWRSQIDSELWDGSYAGTTKDLIRFIRNFYQHPVEIKGIIGKTNSSIDEYFGKTFPRLLIRFYGIARKYWLNDENFKSFLESDL